MQYFCTTGAVPTQGNDWVARAFIAIQNWETPNDLSTSLSQGSVFPSLIMPFSGRRMRGGNFLV